ncbi:hypothetical protein GOP47_0018578 [Adiantum capillus-veneris]|uniref:HAT C-terminal dimerisation domain-containing protein n=1 Tax=Adiantum capillus-veneris TaxID=13818 RepID=A0A9D4UER5_ADICA|nr:hypothetical protein GOP47_0018578 [Adiantum capillus-veneris]
MLLSLALWVLSQEVSSCGAERLWSIMGDIHTKDRNRLNTPQLDRLAFVNANLRVLEKAGGLDSAGPVSWLPKQVDHRQIIVEAVDSSHLQPHTPEDDVYDFIREDMMRFSRQTRSTTRRLRGETTIATTSARPESYPSTEVQTQTQCCRAYFYYQATYSDSFRVRVMRGVSQMDLSSLFLSLE